MLNSARRPVIAYTTLATYQTEFWAEVALELERTGTPTVAISFDDPSTDLLRRKGLRVYSATNAERNPDTSDASFAALAARFTIGSADRWFAHERVAFGLKSTVELRRKLTLALALADRALGDVGREAPVELVQEVGGFLSVVGSWFAAQRLGIRSWFIEPSFFRGRMFLSDHGFGAPVIPAGEAAVSSDVTQYLDTTVRQQAIVVPRKDSHHYAAATRKVFNARNARRLVEKLFDKYVRGKSMEFGYIGHHAATHLRMVSNSRLLRRHYTSPDALGRFVYYPLHVPGDMSLTLRSPEFLDQLALVDYLARSAPPTHKIAIKEHPAMIGALDASAVRALLDRHENVALLPPTTNNFVVLRACEAVVSVNSKSGAEAALLGKPVLVLGDAFYGDSPLVERVRLAELGARLGDILAGDWQQPSRTQVESYFERVWRASVPGELYVAERPNVATFVYGIKSRIISMPEGC